MRGHYGLFAVEEAWVCAGKEGRDCGVGGVGPFWGALCEGEGGILIFWELNALTEC